MSGGAPEISLADIISPGRARADEILRLMERHRGLLAPPSHVEFSVGFSGGCWHVWVFVARCSFGAAHEEVSHETLMHVNPDELASVLVRRLLTRLVYVE